MKEGGVRGKVVGEGRWRVREGNVRGNVVCEGSSV